MSDRIEYLDGLRGLSAFAVFLGHFIPLFIIVAPLIEFAFTVRELSVCIFFVLSGYVLTAGFFKSGNYELIKSGATRRYIRLLIPVLFTIGMVWLFVYRIYTLSSLYDALSMAFYGVFINGQSAFFSGGNTYTGAMWTLGIEFAGSFLVFGFLALFGKSRHRWIDLSYCFFSPAQYILSRVYLRNAPCRYLQQRCERSPENTEYIFPDICVRSSINSRGISLHYCPNCWYVCRDNTHSSCNHIISVIQSDKIWIN